VVDREELETQLSDEFNALHINPSCGLSMRWEKSSSDSTEAKEAYSSLLSTSSDPKS
jgi:hypothetical protein